MKPVGSVLLSLSAVAGCASSHLAAPHVPSTTLIQATGGAPVDALQVAAAAPLTVMIFFSRECHCLAVHDERLRQLYATYHPRGVQLVMVDSEVRASAEADAGEAVRRGYPFPILIDRGAQLADALNAQYATYSVIVNAEGRVLYRGGIDSDKTHLRETATPYLRDALDDLLAGRAPRVEQAKTLGCSLEKW